MGWRRAHRLLAFPVIISLGCAGEPLARPTGAQPDLTGYIQPSGSSSRGQKPEPGSNPLNVAEPVGGIRGARILAVVNDTPILEEEVLAASYSNLIGTRTEAQKAEIIRAKLDEIIERELIIQDAKMKLSGGRERFLDELRKAAGQAFEEQWMHKIMKANNITDEGAFKKMLSEGGMSLALIRRQWERQFIAMEYARGRLESSANRISQGEVVQYYERHPEEFKVEASLEWQDIFILADARRPKQAALGLAKSVVARARRSEDFAKLAKEFDNGDSSLRPNAEGIGKRPGEIRPVEAEATVLALKEGQVGEPVEIETGFHIVKVTKRVAAGKMPFDGKVQKAIRDKLRGEAYSREVKRFVAELKRQAVIQRADVGR
jgi:parvulin-like peptidyl-prolyl isomerase